MSACQRCNHGKADRGVPELGWRLPVVPRQPSGAAWRVLGTDRVDPVWMPYLAAYGADAVTA